MVNIYDHVHNMIGIYVLICQKNLHHTAGHSDISILILLIAFMNACHTLLPDSKVHGSTWGPPGSRRPQMGPMLAPWTLLSGLVTRKGFYEAIQRTCQPKSWSALLRNYWYRYFMWACPAMVSESTTESVIMPNIGLNTCLLPERSIKPLSKPVCIFVIGSRGSYQGR